jgi:hypothetical protein
MNTKKQIIKSLLEGSDFENTSDFIFTAKQMMSLSENTLKALDPKYEICSVY